MTMRFKTIDVKEYSHYFHPTSVGLILDLSALNIDYIAFVRINDLFQKFEYNIQTGTLIILFDRNGLFKADNLMILQYQSKAEDREDKLIEVLQ